MKRWIVVATLAVGCSANPARFDDRPAESEVEASEPQPSPEEVAAERLKAKTEAVKARLKEDAAALLDDVPAVDPEAQELRTRIRRVQTDIDAISPATEEELLTAEFDITQRLSELRNENERRRATTGPSPSADPLAVPRDAPSDTSTGSSF